MPLDPTAASDETQDPEADTPDAVDAPAEDTPEADQPDDWKARYEEAQAVIGRQGHELGLLRRGQAVETDEGTGDEGDAGDQPAPSETPDQYVARLEAQSWDLAERLYGVEALDAYRAAFRIYDRAETPADFIAAFEAYHDLRSQGASPKAAAAAQGAAPGPKSRAEAVQPRVDPSRADTGPDSDEAKLEEARGKGDLKGFVSAATRKMGFGGGTRS